MIRFLPVLVLSLVVAGCQSTPPAVDSEMQQLVEQIASEHPDVTRLSVHAVPNGSDDLHAIASTSAAKRGMLSDPEDMRAVASGEIIVLDEGPGIDITIPILQQNGAYTAAAGVTLDGTADRDAAIATAKTIATQIEAALRM